MNWSHRTNRYMKNEVSIRSATSVARASEVLPTRMQNRSCSVKCYVYSWKVRGRAITQRVAKRSPQKCGRQRETRSGKNGKGYVARRAG